jgi:hypothetical protein
MSLIGRIAPTTSTILVISAVTDVPAQQMWGILQEVAF